jgi:hypothetical protein
VTVTLDGMVGAAVRNPVSTSMPTVHPWTSKFTRSRLVYRHRREAHTYSARSVSFRACPTLGPFHHTHAHVLLLQVFPSYSLPVLQARKSVRRSVRGNNCATRPRLLELPDRSMSQEKTRPTKTRTPSVSLSSSLTVPCQTCGR